MVNRSHRHCDLKLSISCFHLSQHTQLPEVVNMVLLGGFSTKRAVAARASANLRPRARSGFQKILLQLQCCIKPAQLVGWAERPWPTPLGARLRSLPGLGAPAGRPKCSAGCVARAASPGVG